MYSFDSRVRYSEVDENKILTLTSVINYLQDCSTFQSEDVNLGLKHLEKKKKAWMLSSWHILIDRLPKMGERIRVSTWPYDHKGIYGYRNFMIQDAAGNACVRADSTWFLYDMEKNMPVRVQPEDISGYGMESEEKLCMGEVPRHISIPKEYEEAEPIPVMKIHIDTNHHVNNAKYVEFAGAAIGENIQIRELHAEYRKAAMPGDTIYPHVTWENEHCTVALCGQDGKPYAIVWIKK